LTNEFAVPVRRQARRGVLASAGLGVVLALGGCAGGGADFSLPSIEMPSFNLGSSEAPAEEQQAKQAAPVQAVSNEELMKAGPLGEKTMGKRGAAITVIHYASLASASEADFQRSVFPRLKKAYIDTGKVFYIHRDVPDGPAAMAASAAVHCAPAGSYFKLVNKFATQQSAWATGECDPSTIYNVVKETHVKRAAFDTCVKNQNITSGLVWAQERARQFGVTETPVLFINGQRAGGGASMEQLQGLIDPLLPAAPSAKSNSQPGKGRHA
jgi:protein-disulfide isomerase